MFPSSTTTDNLARRSLRELLRGALEVALEFATLGEATLAQPPSRPAPPVHVSEHPHRRALVRPSRPRRAGAVPARAQVCTAPVSARAPGPVAQEAPATVPPPAAPAPAPHQPPAPIVRQTPSASS